MGHCLTPAQIDGVVAGRLSTRQESYARRHLASCETCRRKVESHRANDRLAARIKKAFRRSDSTLNSDPAVTNTPDATSLD